MLDVQLSPWLVAEAHDEHDNDEDEQWQTEANGQTNCQADVVSSRRRLGSRAGGAVIVYARAGLGRKTDVYLKQ